MDEKQIVNALRALNGYGWDASYDEFCKDLGLRKEPSTEGLFRAMGEINRLMTVISPEYLAKIIVVRLASTKQRAYRGVDLATPSISETQLFEELKARLELAKQKETGNAARKVAIAITNLETAMLWWKDCGG